MDKIQDILSTLPLEDEELRELYNEILVEMVTFANYAKCYQSKRKVKDALKDYLDGRRIVLHTTER